MLNIEKIYEEYFNAINRYLFCLTHNKDISEELTQETFYKAVKKIDTYNGNCEMFVWLCQIAKNLWYDKCRKNKKISNVSDEILLNLQEEDTTEDIIMFHEEKLELYKRIQNLDEKSREVVYMRITGELSFKEIGKILKKTESWARVTFYRAKQKLKEVD